MRRARKLPGMENNKANNNSKNENKNRNNVIAGAELCKKGTVCNLIISP
jgi:hypothetical protein